MGQMVEKFEDSLVKGSDEEKLYRDVSTSLKNRFGRYDLETVLLLLESLEDPEKWHPFATFVIDRSKRQDRELIAPNEIITSSVLIDKLKNFLISKCRFVNERFDKNKNVYSDILELVEEIDPVGTSPYMCNTYTTNYDRYFDRFLAERFHYDYSSQVRD